MNWATSLVKRILGPGFAGARLQGTEGTKATDAHRAPLQQRGRKNYDAAIISRLTQDWSVSPLSADAEIRRSYRTLRARSRELERNDPYARNYLFLAENNVIGSKGIGVQMKIQKREKKRENGKLISVLDTDANELVEAAWKRQCRRENFTVQKTLSATAAWKLILRAVLRDGDCLIRKVRGYPNEFGFALQLIESDYLDETYNDCRTLPNGNEVRMGVEIDAVWKFPVAYWLLATHPGDWHYGTTAYSQKRIRIPVEDIIHPVRFERFGQTRGVPAAVAAMLRLNMLGGYDEAELAAARAHACTVMQWLTEVPEEEYDKHFDPEEKAPVFDLNPATVVDPPMGKKLEMLQPTHPNDAYPDFTKAQVRGAAAAFGVSYTSLAGNLEDVNFSSIRAGLLEEREGWKGMQTWFIDDVVTQIFEAWLQMAMLTKLSSLPFDEFDRINAPEFKPRHWPWVDPLKDIQAAKEAINARLDTRSNIIGELGGDFEDTIDEIAYEEEYAEQRGVSLSPEIDAQAEADAEVAEAAAAAAPDDEVTKATKSDAGRAIEPPTINLNVAVKPGVARKKKVKWTRPDGKPAEAEITEE